MNLCLEAACCSECLFHRERAEYRRMLFVETRPSTSAEATLRAGICSQLVPMLRESALSMRIEPSEGIMDSPVRLKYLVGAVVVQEFEVHEQAVDLRMRSNGQATDFGLEAVRIECKLKPITWSAVPFSCPRMSAAGELRVDIYELAFWCTLRVEGQNLRVMEVDVQIVDFDLEVAGSCTARVADCFVKSFKQRIREDVEKELAANVSQTLQAQGPEIAATLLGAQQAAEMLQAPLDLLQEALPGEERLSQDDVEDTVRAVAQRMADLPPEQSQALMGRLMDVFRREGISLEQLQPGNQGPRLTAEQAVALKQAVQALLQEETGTPLRNEKAGGERDPLLTMDIR